MPLISTMGNASMNAQEINIQRKADASGKTLYAKFMLRMGLENVYSAST